MDDRTLSDRVAHHNAEFPPHLICVDDKISGTFVSGNNYRGSGYYGAYPPRYLRRMRAMFPDAESVLHLFSGSVKPGLWKFETTLDINEALEPINVGDAEQLPTYFARNAFDLILADPPYTAKDAEKYGTKMINRKKVIHAAASVLQSGGFLVWMDEVFPMFTKKEFEVAARIGYWRSTNHRIRGVTIFRRQA